MGAVWEHLRCPQPLHLPPTGYPQFPFLTLLLVLISLFFFLLLLGYLLLLYFFKILFSNHMVSSRINLNFALLFF